jgi:hypothetical protein
MFVAAATDVTGVSLAGTHLLCLVDPGVASGLQAHDSGLHDK